MTFPLNVSQLFWGRLCSGRCVAFVGAGFTLPAGFPTWREMVDRLLDQARVDSAHDRKPQAFALAEDFLKSGEYALAADVLIREELLEAQERTRFLERLFVTPRVLDPRMRKRLTSLTGSPWAGIITTNYDRLIEESLTPLDGYCKVENSGPSLGNVLSYPGRFFAKLHGESWKEQGVLTTEDYHRAYLREPYLQKFLEAVMLSHHLVFIGCSLEDELVRLRVRLSDEFRQQIPRAYALLPHSLKAERKKIFLEKFASIECWLYDPDSPLWPRHGIVDEFLSACNECSERSEETALPSKPIVERLAFVGRINRMLLRAILACAGGTVDPSIFVEADALQRTQTSKTWICSYYAHMTKTELLSRLRQLQSAHIVECCNDGIRTTLQVSAEVQAGLELFDTPFGVRV